MSESSGSRTSITIACSKQLKEQVQAAAAARGQSMSDFVVDALADALKFTTFIADTDAQAARDDYDSLIELSRDGKQIP